MDLQDVSAELQRTQERYLRWRDVRQDLAEADAEAPLGQFLSDECLVLEPETPLADREALRAIIDALEDPIREELVQLRRETWTLQGRALRYALALVENRPASIEAETIAAEERDSVAATAADLSGQIDNRRAGLGRWDRRLVHGSALCSVRDIEFPIGTPQHDADKENLEDVLVVAAAANVPSDESCIRLEWDRITDEMVDTRILSEEDRVAA
jgi:hypothetical protein